jgi:hypothetical protein
MTMKCKRCGKRTSCVDLCLTCKTELRRAFRRVEKNGILIDVAGGAWWAWDRIGNVLAGPCDRGDQVLVALGEYSHA